MRLLITAPLQVATGNESSAKRLKKYFEEVNIKCWLKDCNEFDSSIVFNRYVTQNDITAVLAVHAYRGGRLLKDCSVPYGLVLGGTDVNELYKDDDKLVVMTLAVTNARFIIGFSKPMYQQAVWLWPDIACKLWVQPQGVITTPSASFNFKYHVHEHCDVSYDSHIFLLVAGIRPVKDPLYIVQAFSEWYLKDSNIHLVIVGPEIDKELTKTVKGTVAKLAGVSILPVLSLFDMHAAIRDSFALVNSSLSEGMSAAILEAMDLGVPVIVRDIPGNASICKHNETGLLYNTPDDFVMQSKRLLGCKTLQRSLTKNAKVYIRQEHGVLKEKENYTKLINSLLL